MRTSHRPSAVPHHNSKCRRPKVYRRRPDNHTRPTPTVQANSPIYMGPTRTARYYPWAVSFLTRAETRYGRFALQACVCARARVGVYICARVSVSGMCISVRLCVLVYVCVRLYAFVCVCAVD